MFFNNCVGWKIEGMRLRGRKRLMMMNDIKSDESHREKLKIERIVDIIL